MSKLYGSYERWPLESFDGGSHIGLMMMPVNMGRAYDWHQNTEEGRNLFNDKLAVSRSYVTGVRQSHNLRDLSGTEHEMNALVLYGPFASSSQHYYEPNADFSDSIINTSGNSQGVAYANDVVALMP